MATTELQLDAVFSSEIGPRTTEVPMNGGVPDTTKWYLWALLQCEVVLSLGFILNFITLLACWKASILEKGKPVHLFFVNIMVSDLLSCLVGQPWLVFYYSFSGIEFIQGDEWGCLISVVVLLFGLESTFYSILLLTIERFIAIAFPLQHMHRVTKRACKVAIMLTWMLVLFKNGVLFVWHPRSHPYNRDMRCMPQSHMHEEYFTLHNWHLYVVLITIAFFNILIAFVMIASKGTRTALRSTEHNKKQSRLRSELKMLKMMFRVVFVVFLTWMPANVIGNIVYQQSKQGVINRNMLVALHMVRGFSVLGTMTDPLFYIWQNPNCRRAVANLFRTSADLKSSQYITKQLSTISASLPRD